MVLSDLKILLMVIERGSLKGASDALGMSRTTLRRRIDALEESFGAKLLVTDETGVRPTREGAEVLERLPALVRAADDVLRITRSIPSEPWGQVRVLMPLGMPTTLQAQVALHHRSLNQRMVLKVTEVLDPLSHIGERFELMMHFGPPPARGAWFSRVLRRLPLRAYASRTYLARRGTPTRVEDLASHDLLHWVAPGVGGPGWPLLAGGEVAVTPAFESPNVLFLWALAVAHGGIVLAPEDVPLMEPGGDQVVPVLPDVIGGENTLRILSPLPTHVDPSTRAVVEMIQGAMSVLPAT